MTFANEDELAIHTVAAAAYRIVRDLLEKRGRFDIDELVAGGLYLTARSLAAGELSQAALDELTGEYTQLRDFIAALARDMHAKRDAVAPDKFSMSLDRSSRIADWYKLSAAANFLKAR